MGELIVGFLVGTIVGGIACYIAFIKILSESKIIAELYANQSTDEDDDYDEADWWKVGKPNPFG